MPKDNGPLEAKKYTPVTLLPLVSKIFQSILQKQWAKTSQENNVFKAASLWLHKTIQNSILFICLWLKNGKKPGDQKLFQG